MKVVCGQCQSSSVERVRRSGIGDFAQWIRGRYPYRCRRCSTKFYSEIRWVNDFTQARKSSAPPRTPSPPDQKGPASHIAKRDGATAAVVIQAPTEQQLTQILMALSKAVQAVDVRETRKEEANVGGQGRI